jgi:hypothetical protein
LAAGFAQGRGGGRTLKLGRLFTEERLFREAQYSMESNTTTLTSG